MTEFLILGQTKNFFSKLSDCVRDSIWTHILLFFSKSHHKLIWKEELAHYIVDNTLLTQENFPHGHKHSELEVLTEQNKRQKLTRKEKHGVLRRSYCHIVGNPISSPLCDVVLLGSVFVCVCVCESDSEGCWDTLGAAQPLVIQNLHQTIAYRNCKGRQWQTDLGHHVPHTRPLVQASKGLFATDDLRDYT